MEFAEHFKKLFESHEYSDCVINAHSNDYYLHRSVISAGTYFASLISKEWHPIENEKNQVPRYVISFEDQLITQKSFGIAVGSLYGYDLDFKEQSGRKLVELVATLSFLGIEKPLAACVKYIELNYERLAYDVVEKLASCDYGDKVQRVRSKCSAHLFNKLAEITEQPANRQVSLILGIFGTWVFRNTKNYDWYVFTRDWFLKMDKKDPNKEQLKKVLEVNIDYSYVEPTLFCKISDDGLVEESILKNFAMQYIRRQAKNK